jgi:curved DNA-binding protein CbpA
VDTRALPIGPEEAFVLSRVDGISSEAEIAASTGLDTEHVSVTLARLAELGAIRFEAGSDGALPRQPHPPDRAPSQSAMKLPRVIVESPGAEGAISHHPAAALYDPSEIDEDVDVELPRKRKILDMYYRLDSLSHYELLEIEPASDKKQIKEAYFKVVSIFHPDRYYGKRLGTFKLKLEKVFARLTEAHDVLTRSKSREEYDAYLELQRRTRDLERVILDPRLQAAEIEQVRRKIEEQARIAERVEHATPAPRPMDPEERRRALARKLGHSITPGRPTPSPTATPVTQEAIRERVGEDLKRRYADRLAAARNEQIAHFVAAAEQALTANNPVSAANALRVAATLAPDDVQIKSQLAEVQKKASVELAQTYTDQAGYEERAGRLADAARSYEKAAEGRPSARLFERAAFCLLESGGDLRQAGEHAKKAVSLAPQDASYKLTLARIYLGAGMKTSALAELERAAKLAPSDDKIASWIKRIKRGDL